MAWPPDRDAMRQWLDDFYKELPEWKNPDAPVSLAAMRIVDKHAKHNPERFTKYKPILEGYLAHRPTIDDLKAIVTDSESALAMILILDQLTRLLRLQMEERDRPALLRSSGDLARLLLYEHILPLGLDDGAEWGGRRNVLTSFWFITPLAHTESRYTLNLAKERVSLLPLHASEGQRVVADRMARAIGIANSYISRFGRFPFVNDLRQRPWTEQELEWKKTWNGVIGLEDPFGDIVS